jgi:hypothetical protein
MQAAALKPFHFKSTELREAVEAIKPLLDCYESTLDDISHDIKALEKLLQVSPIKEVHKVEVCCDFIDTPSIVEADEPYSRIEMTGTIIKEYLVFGEYEKSIYRLFYLKSKQENLTLENGSIELLGYGEGLEELIERKPLIECSISIRTKLYKFLPQFLNELRRTLPNPTELL